MGVDKENSTPITYHQMVARTEGPTHAIERRIEKRGYRYAERTPCGIKRLTLSQIKKRNFRLSEPEHRCVRCNNATGA